VEVPTDRIAYRDVVNEVAREVIREVPQPVEKIQYREVLRQHHTQPKY
jgi:hypothetical protein